MKLQKELIDKAAACKQPTQAELQSLFAPVKECNDKLSALNRDRDFREGDDGDRELDQLGEPGTFLVVIVSSSPRSPPNS